MGAGTPRRGQFGHDPVSRGQMQAVHPLCRDINAVAVFVDQVSVAVGMHGETGFILPDPGPSGLVLLLGALVVQVHEHQQYVGKVHHQTDRHGNQQVQHHIGVFRLQFHGRFSVFRSGAVRAFCRRAEQPRVSSDSVGERGCHGLLQALPESGWSQTPTDLVRERGSRVSAPRSGDGNYASSPYHEA